MTTIPATMKAVVIHKYAQDSEEMLQHLTVKEHPIAKLKSIPLTDIHAGLTQYVSHMTAGKIIIPPGLSL